MRGFCPRRVRVFEFGVKKLEELSGVISGCRYIGPVVGAGDVLPAAPREVMVVLPARAAPCCYGCL